MSRIFTLKTAFRRLIRPFLQTVFVCFFSVLIVISFNKQARAFFCPLCLPPVEGFCSKGCDKANSANVDNHSNGINEITDHVIAKFEAHREWLTTSFFEVVLNPDLKQMTQQFSAMALFQTQIIGTFFDAEQQLETQRLHQELQALAHKDYHPSEGMCVFGTAVRSLGNSELKGRYNTLAFAERSLQRHLGKANKPDGDSIETIAANSDDADKQARWQQFSRVYCDPKDNDGVDSEHGLAKACRLEGAPDPERYNRDIDFTRLIEQAHTLGADFTDDSFSSDGTEEDVLAMANNLYGHNVLSRDIDGSILRKRGAQELYMALRSVAAKRSVAENSFSSIVGLKSAGSDSSEGTRVFLQEIMKELGVADSEIVGMIGERPSYYAQLEILAKKIYQSPEFYSELYDKPANVRRKSVALKAIELMLDRAIFESQLRQEMVTSVLLSSRLRPYFKSVKGK